MRCICLSEIDAFLTVMGVRRYQPRPTSTAHVDQVVAIHASAEPTSWAEVVRRMEKDVLFRAALDGFQLDSPATFKTLARGAIVGTARLARVLRAGDYDPPLLASPRPGERFLWELVDTRAIEPVERLRARSNLWSLSAEVEGAVRDAPERERQKSRIAVASAMEMPLIASKEIVAWRETRDAFVEKWREWYRLNDESGAAARAEPERPRMRRRGPSYAIVKELGKRQWSDEFGRRGWGRIREGAIAEVISHGDGREPEVMRLLKELQTARQAVRRIRDKIKRLGGKAPDARTFGSSSTTAP